MTPKPGGYLLIHQLERLDEWGRKVWTILGHYPYLVGSAMRGPNFRDVDVRVVLPDAVYDRWWRVQPLRVRYANRAFSVWGQQETGLPIDFQIQRQSNAPDGMRSPLGTRDWAMIPTDGAP